jgi:hypothetical protein
VDKLYDAFISLLAGAHGMVEMNTRLRTDLALQQAFGRKACAEQSVVQETLDACTTEHARQMQHTLPGKVALFLSVEPLGAPSLSLTVSREQGVPMPEPFIQRVWI